MIRQTTIHPILFGLLPFRTGGELKDEGLMSQVLIYLSSKQI